MAAAAAGRADQDRASLSAGAAVPNVRAAAAGGFSGLARFKLQAAAAGRGF